MIIQNFNKSDPTFLFFNNGHPTKRIRIYLTLPHAQVATEGQFLIGVE